MMNTAPFILALADPLVTPVALVCDSPHSGTNYPDDFCHAVERSALRKSEDTDVDLLWEGVTHAGGTLLCARFPRSYIDTNRDLCDMDTGMLDNTWPEPVSPSERTLELGIGLVWRETPSRERIYNRLLTVAEVIRRIESFWKPYRQALREALAQSVLAHGGYLHLNLHSMPGNAYERLGVADKKTLADIVLGDRHGTTCSQAITNCVADRFRELGYSVAINDPYEGLSLVRESGFPAEGRHSLQIEINRAIYMNEHTRVPNDHFSKLRTDINQVLVTLRTGLLDGRLLCGRRL